MGLAASDPEDEVRNAAVRVLGRIGDRTTLDFLRGYARDHGPKKGEVAKFYEEQAQTAVNIAMEDIRVRLRE